MFKEIYVVLNKNTFREDLLIPYEKMMKRVNRIINFLKVLTIGILATFVITVILIITTGTDKKTLPELCVSFLMVMGVIGLDYFIMSSMRDKHKLYMDLISNEKLNASSLRGIMGYLPYGKNVALRLIHILLGCYSQYVFFKDNKAIFRYIMNDYSANIVKYTMDTSVHEKGNILVVRISGVTWVSNYTVENNVLCYHFKIDKDSSIWRVYDTGTE